MAGDSRLRLQVGTTLVEVDPERGGRLSTLVVDGHPLLFGARSTALQWGSYPMVPWAGRIADGRFSFAGRANQLPLNLPPHAAHGLGFTAPWSVADHGPTSIELTLDLQDPWPYGGRVEQRFALEAGSLLIELSVVAESAMPIMVGWHPWFNRFIGGTGRGPVEAELEFGAASMYELDRRAIPTGRLVPPSPRPWDNCFTDVHAGPTLSWPGMVELRLSSSCDHWVVYDRPGHAICVEPQSAAPDAFNREPTAMSPGDRLDAWFRLDWGRTPHR